MHLQRVFLLPLLVLACNQTPDAPVTPVTAAAPASKSVVATAATIAGGQTPTAVAAAPAAPAGALSGKVAERLSAGGYTYLRLTTATGDVWTAVPETATPVGADVSITSPMAMPGFESKTLARKFDMIYFGTLGGAGGGQVAGGAGSQPTGSGSQPTAAGSQPVVVSADMPHGPTATPPAEMGPIKVAKAEGPDARTVAEVFAQKAALKDKTVTVRGKVVKFSGGVMGKNWVHVRDGSGGDATKDNDLTFTTQDVVALGDEVVAKGTVHTDKDFGAGYFYSIIVEEGSVTK